MTDCRHSLLDQWTTLAQSDELIIRAKTKSVGGSPPKSFVQVVDPCHPARFVDFAFSTADFAGLGQAILNYARECEREARECPKPA